MVLQRTIENLRERPKDERRAVALGISIAVMVVLFIGWAGFFFNEVNVGQVQEATGAYQNAVANVQEAYSQTGWVSEAPQTSKVAPVASEVAPDSDDSDKAMQLIEEEAPTGVRTE